MCQWQPKRRARFLLVSKTMKASILIVDDEPNMLTLLDRVLSAEGYRVKTATNPFEALYFLDHEQFHAAVLDVNIYPMDGVGVLTEIKKRMPSLPVVMITGHHSADLSSECMKRGAAHYLPKPLEMRELKRVLKGFLNSKTS